MKQCSNEQRLFLETLYNLQSPVDRKTETIMTFIKGSHDLSVTVEKTSPWFSKCKFIYQYQHRMGNNYPSLSYSTDVPLCSPVSIPIDSLPSSNADISTQLTWLKPAALYQILFKKYELKKLVIHANPTIHDILASLSITILSQTSTVVLDMEQGTKNSTESAKMLRVIKNIITIFPEQVTFVLYNPDNEKLLTEFIKALPYDSSAIDSKLHMCRELQRMKQAVCCLEAAFDHYLLKKRIHGLVHFIYINTIKQAFLQLLMNSYGSADECSADNNITTKRENLYIDDADDVPLMDDVPLADNKVTVAHSAIDVDVLQHNWTTLQHQQPSSVSVFDTLEEFNMDLLFYEPSDSIHSEQSGSIYEMNPYKSSTLNNWTTINVQPLPKSTLECYMTVKPLPQFPVIPMMDIMCDCIMLCHDYLFNYEFMQSSMMSDDTEKYTIECDQSNQRYVIKSVATNSASLLLPENIVNVINSDEVNQEYSYIFPHSDSDLFYAPVPQTIDPIESIVHRVPSISIDSTYTSSQRNDAHHDDHDDHEGVHDDQDDTMSNSSADALLDHRWYNIIVETKRNILQFFFNDYSQYHVFVQHLREMNLL